MLFGVWFAGLVVCLVWLIKKKRQIRKNEDIQLLVDARQEQGPELSERDRQEHAEDAYHKFCEKQSLTESAPVAQHLKAIFLAGWDENRLEVSELINHTTSNLFKWNGPLRSVLAIFIVIGLLGTLFGLTDSLTQLSPALEASAADETSAENSEKMTQALSLLLGEMKSAFAPSILGIFFTIVGVVLYNAYLRFACQSVQSALERLTLTIWIPQLYPTTSQRLIQTLQQSEEQMRSGYETATRVGELVETVQDNISDFNQNLSRANNITQPLSNSVAQINGAANILNETFVPKLDEFSQEFAANVSHLTGFQDEIRDLYQQLKHEYDTFQKDTTQRLDQQNQNLVATLNALKSYEEAYVASRHKIDETLQKFLSEATETNNSINANNRRMLESIHNQLASNLAGLQTTLEEQLRTVTGGLTTDLGGLQQTLETELRALTDRFNRFDVPLQKAADQIEGILESFVRLMQRTVGDLRREIQTQNENYESQLEAVTNLNQEIVTLLNQLDNNSRDQSSAISTLSNNINSLGEGIHPLSDVMQSLASDSDRFSQSIGTIGQHIETLDTTSKQLIERVGGTTQSLIVDSGALSRSIDAIEQHVETLGTASQQLVERADITPLRDDIGDLRESIREIAQHSRTLAESAQILARQTPPSSQGDPDRSRSPWNIFRRPSSSEAVDRRENENESTRSDT